MDIGVLEAVERLLPDNRHVDLDLAVAAVTSRLTEHRLAHTGDPAQRALLHATLGYRLANAGQYQQALSPSEEAVAIYRRLAEASPAAYLPDLARGLWGFAWVRAAGGLELSEALTAVEEATEIYTRLAEQLPKVFARDLLSAYHTMADVLDGLGRTDEAAELRRQLGEDSR